MEKFVQRAWLGRMWFSHSVILHIPPLLFAGRGESAKFGVNFLPHIWLGVSMTNLRPPNFGAVLCPPPLRNSVCNSAPPRSTENRQEKFVKLSITQPRTARLSWNLWGWCIMGLQRLLNRWKPRCAKVQNLVSILDDSTSLASESLSFPNEATSRPTYTIGCSDDWTVKFRIWCISVHPSEQ